MTPFKDHFQQLFWCHGPWLQVVGGCPCGSSHGIQVRGECLGRVETGRSGLSSEPWHLGDPWPVAPELVEVAGKPNRPRPLAMKKGAGKWGWRFQTCAHCICVFFVCIGSLLYLYLFPFVYIDSIYIYMIYIYRKYVCKLTYVSTFLFISVGWS